MNYDEFLEHKSQIGGDHGFEPVFMPNMAFPFQEALITWATKKGRSLVAADCGLGKSLIELAFAQNVVEKTNQNVLMLTPLAVGQQMVRESEKFGIEAKRSRDGKPKGKITITNYEQLDKFSSSDYGGIVCDESSIMKNYDGKTKQLITIFSRKMKYRLLATATAAPNDYIELGTSSEALGELGYMDMLSRYFKNDQNSCKTRRGGRFTTGDTWRMMPHAKESFWRWVSSWMRAIRMPSDLGFSNDGYILPGLKEIEHELRDLEGKPEGFLFSIPAVGLKEVRDEIVATAKERCEYAAEIATTDDDFTTIWCNRNNEGDMLEKMIPGSVQVSGKDSDESKEEKLVAFSAGQVKKLITKPKIGAWGLNWQHCAHTVFFPTYSYEQYYQAVRRHWRFGQERTVRADLVFSEGCAFMLDGLRRKKVQAEEMFTKLVEYMNDSLRIKTGKEYTEEVKIPSWIGGTR
jgi:hypothetical protein